MRRSSARRCAPSGSRRASCSAWRTISGPSATTGSWRAIRRAVSSCRQWSKRQATSSNCTFPNAPVTRRVSGRSRSSSPAGASSNTARTLTSSLAELTLPQVSNPTLQARAEEMATERWRVAPHGGLGTGYGGAGQHRPVCACPHEPGAGRSGYVTGVDAAFGIRDGAWQAGNQIHGVTFRILEESPDGKRAELWSRTLQPLTVAADRGLQHVLVPLPSPAKRLIFETAGFGRRYALGLVVLGSDQARPLTITGERRAPPHRAARP